MPDPQLQFIVEVDASNEGMGAVLSQRSPQDQRIHPCAFLSRKLSPAEQNYDVGNWELLAIKVALEEWNSPSPTGRDHRTPNQMFCPACMTLNRQPRNLKPSYHLTMWQGGGGVHRGLLSVCAARGKASRQARVRGYSSHYRCHIHRPWSHLTLDFITGLPPLKGNLVVMMVVDRFSKMTHFIPLTKLPSAKETATVMINHVFHIFRIHGRPTDIVSDRGPQFISCFWKEFCQLLGATVSLSSGYYPESNGQTEWLNQELETCLRCLVAHNQTSWSDHLTWIEYAHNSLPMAAIGLSPFQVIPGYQPPLFPANEEEVTVPSAHAMAKWCKKIWAAVRQMLIRGQERMKSTADHHHRPAPVYTLGQKVWLSTSKLQPGWSWRQKLRVWEEFG
ncbi:hypothetical protein L3Q82_013013 [Scortum barcoo]|uniref:Uncharacterized protein n=1 Tax=Scortum barcoo TaxID=214431 RepID=A0ACB8VYX9_9TELE|nr:hypothetical protein L3Q82_013013 [Scortum barcoo]